VEFVETVICIVLLVLVPIQIIVFLVNLAIISTKILAFQIVLMELLPPIEFVTLVMMIA
jgi:hypothetical protein